LQYNIGGIAQEHFERSTRLYRTAVAQAWKQRAGERTKRTCAGTLNLPAFAQSSIERSCAHRGLPGSARSIRTWRMPGFDPRTLARGNATPWVAI